MLMLLLRVVVDMI